MVAFYSMPQAMHVKPFVHCLRSVVICTSVHVGQSMSVRLSKELKHGSLLC